MVLYGFELTRVEFEPHKLYKNIQAEMKNKPKNEEQIKNIIVNGLVPRL